MTQVNSVFRLRVHDPGTTTPSAGTVDFVLDDLADVPQFGGQLVRPTDGASTLGTWAFTVVDTSGIITANLSDPSTGRADLLARLVEVQENRNAGGWATLTVARLTGLTVAADEQSRYDIELSDERWLERRAQVFRAADTAYLWPAGLRYAWRGFTALEPYVDGEVQQISGSYVRLRLSSDRVLSSAVIEWIRGDLKDDPSIIETTNFEHLRVRVGSTDYPVASFGSLTGTDYLATLSEFDPSRRTAVSVWVYAPSGFGAVGTALQARLWAPTAPPSETLPLHLGTFSYLPAGPSGHLFGFRDPFDLLEAIYDEAGVRYDSSATGALKDRYPNMGWRITDPETTVAEFVEKQIYAPLGIVPFVDDSGRVSPRSIRLPAAADFDPSTAFEFNAANCSRAPSFDHSVAEIVNVITVEGRGYRPVAIQGGAVDGQLATPARPVRTDFAADFIEERELTVGPVDFGSVTQDLGPHPKTFTAHGLATGLEAFGGLNLPSFDPLLNAAKALRAETFDRFGDGPVWGKLVALRTPQDGSSRTPEGREPGELVVLNLATWPNMATQSRGGARIVQLMSRKPGPEGVEFEFLDVGPNLQPLATPTVALAANATDPRHARDTTIGSVPAGARAQLRVGFGSGSAFHLLMDDVSSGTIRSLPSGTQIRVQVRAVKEGRVSSLWSSTATSTTSTLAAPTSLSATATGRGMKLEWTNAVAGYPLMPVFRTAGGGSWTDALEAPLPPGSTSFVFAPQAASTSYDWGVRHVDEFAGLGTVAYATASTSTARKLATPRRPQVLQGRGSGSPDDLAPEELRVGYGIEVGYVGAEPSAGVVAQVSTDSGFASIDLEVGASAGAKAVTIFTGGLDETVRYIRLLHRRAGFTDSDASAVVSSKPTALVNAAGSDAFPGGFAEVIERDGGKLEIFVQAGGDPDTDSAFYAWAKNPSPEDYPTVDDTSRELDPLPARENLNDDTGSPPTDEVFADGDVIMIRVRFSGATVGFGGEFLIRHVYGAGAEVVVSLDRLELYNPTSGPFPLAILRMRAWLRAPASSASVHSTLTVTPWNNGTWSYDPQAVREADVNVTVTGGLMELICPTTGGGPNTFLLKDQIDSWDVDIYDAVGGAAGAGTLIASFRVVADVLAYLAGAGQVPVYDTAGTGNVFSGNGLRLGDDAKGDGVFKSASGGIVKQRDAHSAGTVSGTWQPDYADGPCQYATLAANTTLQVPANWGTGRPMNLRIALSGHTLTFQSSRFYADGSTLPTLTGVVFLSLVQVATNYVVVAALSDLGAV